MRTILLSIIIAFTTLQVNAQKVKIDKIKTSIQCEMCVDRLTNIFAKKWAIKDVDFDLENQLVSVKYNSKKMNLVDLEQLISDSGYDANEKQANQEVYDALPLCCKKKASSCGASHTNDYHTSKKKECGTAHGCKKSCGSVKAACKESENKNKTTSCKASSKEVKSCCAKKSVCKGKK